MMINTQPPPLKPGDKIAIAATARKITAHEIEYAVQLITNWGFEVVIPPDLFAQQNQLAGSDELRTAVFQSLLDDDEVKAILCARGGYGTLKMIDGIKWDNFKNNPKWIIGYSDITVLHNHVYQHTGIASIHGTMAFNITHEPERQPAIQSLLNVLQGGEVSHPLQTHPLNREGNANGVLVGGNLSVLYSLMGSASFPDTNGKLLFLEDLDEYLYHIDRMITALKRASKLNNLAGLIVGGMTDMKDNPIPYGKTAEEIILEAAGEYDYPVYFGFEAGHIPNNLAIKMGAAAKITNNTLVFE